MKTRKFLLLNLLILTLTGCSLAWAEVSPGGGDRWVGFYVVPSQSGRDAFSNDPYLEEYGTLKAEAGRFGTLTFPKDVLFAVEDSAGNYTFPGIGAGFSLFYLDGTTDAGNSYVRVVSDMGAHENGLSFADRDEGSFITLSGTVYCGPPLGVMDWAQYGNDTVWTFYQVYQTGDGRVYLDGSGNSTNGPMTHSMTETRTVRKNGETMREETLTVTAAVEAIPRLERLVVTQFDENNAVLRSEEMSLQSDRTEVGCLAETAWILVEEISAEGVKRTAYNIPEGEEPVSHDYVLLDDDGYGCLACLDIYAQSFLLKGHSSGTA